jgi:DNA-binding transcriptional LysR family regulator
MDARRLRLLAELERLGTLAAVAEELHVTAPGISMQLASLEREVGLALTERQGRRLVLTPAGRVLARHGKDVSDMLSVAAMDARALREGTGGTYRVAAFPTAIRSFVAATCRRLEDEPERGLHLFITELEPQDALPALAAGEVELVVAHSYSNLPKADSPGLITTPLLTEPVYLATRRDDPAVSGDSVDLRGFARHEWIVANPRLTCHQMTRYACAAAGFEPRAVAEATDYAAQLALVAAGAGVALIPALAARDLPDEVVLRPLRTPVHRDIFAVTRRAGAADPGLSALVGLLTEHAAV